MLVGQLVGLSVKKIKNQILWLFDELISCPYMLSWPKGMNTDKNNIVWSHMTIMPFPQKCIQPELIRPCRACCNLTDTFPFYQKCMLSSSSLDFKFPSDPNGYFVHDKCPPSSTIFSGIFFFGILFSLVIGRQYSTRALAQIRTLNLTLLATTHHRKL